MLGDACELLVNRETNKIRAAAGARLLSPRRTAVKCSVDAEIYLVVQYFANRIWMLVKRNRVGQRRECRKLFDSSFTLGSSLLAYHKRLSHHSTGIPSICPRRPLRTIPANANENRRIGAVIWIFTNKSHPNCCIALMKRIPAHIQPIAFSIRTAVQWNSQINFAYTHSKYHRMPFECISIAVFISS